MIRAMEVSDIHRVAEIHVFGWRSAFRGIISDEHLFKVMHAPKGMEHFENSLSDSWAKTYVFDDRIIKAFVVIGPCRDEDKPGAFELGGIYVEPLMKRQGIGSLIVNYCERKAAEQGYKEICLWTLEESWSSRRFYENAGYLPDGTGEIHERLGVPLIRYCRVLQGVEIYVFDDEL